MCALSNKIIHGTFNMDCVAARHGKPWSCLSSSGIWQSAVAVKIKIVFLTAGWTRTLKTVNAIVFTTNKLISDVNSSYVNLFRKSRLHSDHIMFQICNKTCWCPSLFTTCTHTFSAKKWRWWGNSETNYVSYFGSSKVWQLLNFISLTTIHKHSNKWMKHFLYVWQTCIDGGCY